MHFDDNNTMRSSSKRIERKYTHILNQGKWYSWYDYKFVKTPRRVYSIKIPLYFSNF